MTDLVAGKYYFHVWTGLVVVCAFSWATNVQAQITKCQDADGNWHYGNYAADVCAESDITHLDRHGNVIAEESRPLTEAELAEIDDDADQEAQLQAAKQAEPEEQDRLASIYDSEQDIIRMRDNKIESIDQRVATVEALLSQRRSRLVQVDQSLTAINPDVTSQISKLTEEREFLSAEIFEREAEIVESQAEKAEIEMYYRQELELYRKYF